MATATAIAALVFFVSRAANPREEGGSLTGTVGPLAAPDRGDGGTGGGTGGADIDARLDQARAALERGRT